MSSERILSIDIFRGFTIFMMVFVNDLAGVTGIPQWMKHVAADTDGMTFVDVVFPAFLFIVGIAIPFAVTNRLKKDDSLFSFWLHVFLRTLGLLVLGVYMVNAQEMNVDSSLISKALWTASLYVAAVLIWNKYPPSKNKMLSTGLQILGVLILIALYFLFRKGPESDITRMTPSWWGILGLIGWAYLFSMIIYLLCEKKMEQVGISICLLGLVHFLIRFYSDVNFLNFLKNFNGHICHTFIVTSGIFCSLLIREAGVKINAHRKIGKLIIIGGLMALIAFLIRPYSGGISKIGATPAWALYCSAICYFFFAFFYWLIDIKGISKWAHFLKPAGTNPLLTYIIPPFIYAVIGFNFYPEILNVGALGFVRAVIFSLVVLWIAKLLTSKGIVLKL